MINRLANGEETLQKVDGAAAANVMESLRSCLVSFKK